MGGRNGKSIDLHLAGGNTSHLTKAQIEARKNAEIKLGADDLKKVKAPPDIKNDANMYKRWKAIIADYKDAAARGIELISTSDIDAVATYCRTFSEYENLQAARSAMNPIFQRDPLMMLDPFLKLEAAINKKSDQLLKFQDRLFLNPLAKVKNIPKPAKQDDKPSKFGRFGGGRSG
jgi:phage terminase small subunit